MLLGREKKERRALKCILEGGILCQRLRKSVVHKLSAIKRGNQGDQTIYFLAGPLTTQFPSIRKAIAFECLLPGGDLAFLDRSYRATKEAIAFRRL